MNATPMFNCFFAKQPQVTGILPVFGRLIFKPFDILSDGPYLAQFSYRTSSYLSHFF
jgi:hypothetical protein